MAELMENIMAAPAAWIILQITSEFKLEEMPQAKELKVKRAIPSPKSLALPVYSATLPKIISKLVSVTRYEVMIICD
jgi:hypothetical protein